MDILKILSDTVFKAPLSLVSRLFQSKMGIFVYGIMSHWYIMIMLGSSIVAFWVFKGLEEAGILSEAYEMVSHIMEDSKSIARYCTPKIRDLNAVWECVQNPPRYERTRSEQQLYDSAEEENQQIKKQLNYKSRGTGDAASDEDDPYANISK